MRECAAPSLSLLKNPQSATDTNVHWSGKCFGALTGKNYGCKRRPIDDLQPERCRSLRTEMTYLQSIKYSFTGAFRSAALL